MEWFRVSMMVRFGDNNLELVYVEVSSFYRYKGSFWGQKLEYGEVSGFYDVRVRFGDNNLELVRTWRGFGLL